MKRFLVFLLALGLILTAGASAQTLPVDDGLRPNPEDYANTDLTEAKTIVMLQVGDGSGAYPDYEAVLEKINERLSAFNTTLECVFVGWSDFTSMYSLLLTGGDDIDIAFASTWCFFWSEAAKGSYYALDEEFIEKYMPYTAKYQPEVSWGEVTYRGQIQSVTQNKTPTNQSVGAVRTDLADKYGLNADITTWEDLRAYMLGIAAHTDETGIFAYNAGKEDSTYLYSSYIRQFNTFAVCGTSDFRFVGGEEVPTVDELVFTYTSDMVASWAKEANDLLEQGCWSRSALSNTTMHLEAFQNGTSAVICRNGSIFWYMNLLEESVLGVARGEATKPFLLYPEYLSPAEGYNNNSMAITACSKDPQRAAMVIDILKFDYDLNNLICLGIEGEHWVDLGDGYYENGPSYEAYQPYALSWSWGLQNDNWRNVPVSEAAGEQDEFVRSHLYINPTMSFAFDNEPCKSFYNAVQATITEYRAALYLGLAGDPEVAFAEFGDRLYEAGLEEYETEYKKQYQAWYETL